MDSFAASSSHGKNSYGMEYVELERLEHIDFETPGVVHYNYRGVDFMYRVQPNASKLVVSFHGSLSYTKHFLKEEELNDALAANSSEEVSHRNKFMIFQSYLIVYSLRPICLETGGCFCIPESL
jgi:hypothetical protein